MDPTQILRDEHVMIRAALRAFSALADKVERGEPFPEKLAAGALDFFANFADAHHHAKEERQLFPALAGRSFAPRHGVVDALRQQHDLGRTLVRDMRQRLAEVRAGDPTAASAFADSARSYAELLRVHIEIEDHDVFPEAERTLDAGVQRRLREAFDELDAVRSARQDLARWERLADDVAGKGNRS
jgi:hemerythrin-like domain-containing protein